MLYQHTILPLLGGFWRYCSALSALRTAKRTRQRVIAASLHLTSRGLQILLHEAHARCPRPQGTGGAEKLEALDPASHAGSTKQWKTTLNVAGGRLEHKTAKLSARQPSPTRSPLSGFRHPEPRVSPAGLWQRQLLRRGARRLGETGV